MTCCISLRPMKPPLGKHKLHWPGKAIYINMRSRRDRGVPRDHILRNCFGHHAGRHGGSRAIRHRICQAQRQGQGPEPGCVVGHGRSGAVPRANMPDLQMGAPGNLQGHGRGSGGGGKIAPPYPALMCPRYSMKPSPTSPLL